MTTDTVANRLFVRRSRWLGIVGIFITMILAAPVSRGASDEKGGDNDARLEGFPQALKMEDAGGTVPTWMLFGALGTVVVGVLFMNSKRTHLD